jgi:23S rRNA (guanosine2251-2'-O)-methyltransferase
LDEKKAQSLARGGAHQGFLAKVKPIELKSINELKKLDFLLVLVGVTDMGNIGSIIRSAYSLGVDGLILTGSKTFNLEGAVKPSSGAIFELPIGVVTNPLDLINELKLDDFSLYGAVLDGWSGKNISVSGKRALFMGSEGEGLPNRVIEKLDRKVTISMKNNFDSLNVAIATAILIDRMNG